MRLPTPGGTSLAKLLHDYGERWEIEKVARGTEWIGVLRETGGDYIRIVGASDLDGLRYRMGLVEKEEPEEREPGGSGL
jgi:hypothetical protein